MYSTEGNNGKKTHFSHLRYTKLGTQARYIYYICVELSLKPKLRDFKQDGVIFKSATKHQLDLRLHPMKPKILTDLMF